MSIKVVWQPCAENMANAALTDSALKRSLKAYIVPPFIKKYQVVSVRTLFSHKSLWLKRTQLENILKENEKVVAFFSCVTALNKPKRKSTQARKYLTCVWFLLISLDSKCNLSILKLTFKTNCAYKCKSIWHLSLSWGEENWKF